MESKFAPPKSSKVEKSRVSTDARLSMTPHVKTLTTTLGPEPFMSVFEPDEPQNTRTEANSAFEGESKQMLHEAQRARCGLRRWCATVRRSSLFIPSQPVKGESKNSYLCGRRVRGSRRRGTLARVRRGCCCCWPCRPERRRARTATASSSRPPQAHAHTECSMGMSMTSCMSMTVTERGDVVLAYKKTKDKPPLVIGRPLVCNCNYWREGNSNKGFGFSRMHWRWHLPSQQARTFSSPPNPISSCLSISRRSSSAESMRPSLTRLAS